MLPRSLILILLSTELILFTSAQEESFKEELLLRPLPNGDLLAHFRFTTLSATRSNFRPQRDFHLFPRALGELIQHHSLRELEVSLSRGVWRQDLWGAAPISAPPGARVAAWFDQDGSVRDVDANWRQLTNALAGQLCASLNFLDSTTSVSPRFAFRPLGVGEIGGEVNGSMFRVGMLPGENVCTENLSPWKKLLPCGAKRGLSTLLNAGSIHRSKHHSVTLSLRQVCPSNANSCSRTSTELVQSVTLVFSPNHWPENYEKASASWSIRSLFGIGLTSVCPLASSSNIYVDDPDSELTFADDLPHTKTDQNTFIFDPSLLLTQGSSNIIASYKKSSVKLLHSSKPTLQATRYLTGYGQQEGEVVTKIRNSGKESVSIVFFDVLPWYLRLYFHTLKVTLQNGKTLKPIASALIPGIDRVRPYSIELVLKLPPKSVTTVSIAFEKSILKWLEYPPDANHGFYVGPATITAVRKSNGSSVLEESSVLRLYTEILLVNLPTPDFSMPYNVICLACTVVALAFGPLHNITTKSLVMEAEGDRPKGMLDRVMDKVAFWKKRAANNVVVEGDCGGSGGSTRAE